MNIQEKDIAGLPMKAVRDFIREHNNKRFTKSTLRSVFGREAHVDRLVHELLARKWIKQLDANSFETTTAGNQFGNVLLLKRLPREKANRLFSEFLERVREVNADDYYLYVVDEVRVFGSYLGNSPDLGDLDLCVSLSPRNGDREKAVKQSLARAPNGMLFANRLFYGQTEVMKKLKSRSPYLRFHETSELAQLGAVSKVVFSLSNEQAREH